eukprot:152076_1
MHESILVFVTFICILINQIHADSSFIIQVNASNVSTKTIWNPWTAENIADYTQIWLNTADIDKTKPNIKAQYPFLSIQKIAYGTGGCYKGYKDANNATCRTTFDLLQNPSDTNSAYNFTQLHIAVDNIIKMGLKPYIVTGLIPISYSNNAILSEAKNLNELPPSNYDKYGEYIYELGKYFLNIYGTTHVKQWLFGVITEYNNYRHFDDIYDVNDTMNEYFKVFDYTECNLKKAFGANNFKIGAHSARNMGTSTNSWNADLLLNHVANEKNYCSGTVGTTQMDFYSSSFYEGVSSPGDQSKFDEYICSMHDAIKQYNLEDKIKEVAIDEGRIIKDQYNLQIQHRSVGRTYQASWDALFFYNMIRCNISRFTRWIINTNGLGINTTDSNSHGVSPIDPVSANVGKLTYKMNGDVILETNMIMNGYKDELEKNNVQIVNGMGSLSNDGIVRVFVFNHNSDVYSTQTANVSVQVCDMNAYGDGKSCNITEWMIDDNHSQFWNIYWNDVLTHNISSFCPVGWSNQSEIICLSDERERDYIQSRTPIYQKASKLISNKYKIEYKAKQCVEISKQMIPTHGVRLFEISC